MIALTQRLNERDEQILAMQEELEAYDRHQRRLEDALDQKVGREAAPLPCSLPQQHPYATGSSTAASSVDGAFAHNWVIHAS